MKIMRRKKHSRRTSIREKNDTQIIKEKPVKKKQNNKPRETENQKKKSGRIKGKKKNEE